MVFGLEKFFKPVEDPNRVICVDDAPSFDPGLFPKAPGGPSAYLDAYKTLTGATEKEARANLQAAGITPWAHGDVSLGQNGCHYGHLVEHEHHLVGAPEAVSASDRFAWAQESGKTDFYMRPHDPKAAVTNHVEGTTFDNVAAYVSGQAAFNHDAWRTREVAVTLGVDPDKFAALVQSAFEATVNDATGGSIQFFERK